MFFGCIVGRGILSYVVFVWFRNASCFINLSPSLNCRKTEYFSGTSRQVGESYILRCKNFDGQLLKLLTSSHTSLMIYV